MKCDLGGAAAQGFVAIYKNGAEYIRAGQFSAQTILNPSVSTLLALTDADYLEVFASQSSGSNQNVLAGATLTQVSITKVK
jgi:hypothetical protein